MAIYRLGAHAPRIPASAYVAPEAVLIGNVTLGERASVWPCAVIRGDGDAIVIGDGSNVQDGAVLHVDPGCPLTIGANVTVGHQAMLHGCTIGDDALIGIQAVILNRASIGRGCLVAAGAIVTERKVFAERALVVGAPARVLRELTEVDMAAMREALESYLRRAERYRTELERIG